MKDLSEFEPLVAMDVVGVPSPTIQFFVRQAAIKFCNDTQIINRMFSFTVASTDIEDDVQDYVDLDLGEYGSQMRPFTLMRLNINGSDWKAQYLDIQTTIEDSTSVLESDVMYFTFPNNSTLRIFGMSACTLTVQIAFKPTQSATTLEDVLFEDWLDVITSGAKAGLFFMSNKMWSDTTAGTIQTRMFQRGVSTAKARTRKGFTNKSLTIQPKEFGYYDG